jgi:hypothetical protein
MGALACSLLGVTWHRTASLIEHVVVRGDRHLLLTH